MRTVLMVALSALVLTGCGAPGSLTGAYAPEARSLSSRTVTLTDFTQVLRHEKSVWTAAQKAVETFVSEKEPAMVMPPVQGVSPAQHGSVFELAARPLSGGRTELVAMVSFTHHIPGTFLTGQANRAVRMVLDTHGQAVKTELEGATVTDPVKRPVFEAVDASVGRTLMADVAVFLRRPAQKPLLQSRLWEAIAGLSSTNTFTVGPVRATKSDFGAFGRIFRFRGTLKHQGVPVMGERDMELEVVTDRQGRVVGVN